MKKIYLISLFFAVFTHQIFAKDISINIAQLSNSTFEANVGDVITFVVTSPHTATQVSKTTWDNVGTTFSFPALSGGFDFSSSSSTKSITLTSNDIGTIYFGCKPHAGSGMKGTINVTSVTNFEDNKLSNLDFNVYPNPTTGILKFNHSGAYQVEVLNMLGVEVLEVSTDNNLIDLSALPQGVYLVRFRKDGDVYAKRVIKK